MEKKHYKWPCSIAKLPEGKASMYIYRLFPIARIDQKVKSQSIRGVIFKDGPLYPMISYVPFISHDIPCIIPLYPSYIPSELLIL